MNAASALIELKNLSLSFDGECILGDINLKIHKGERIVLIGPSGHGKSLLIKLMTGLVQPTKGQVLIEGADYKSLSRSQRAGLISRMGLLFQKNALFDSLTCLENIVFVLEEVKKLSTQEAEQKAHYLIEAVGIPHAAHLYPDELSGGMQKRLGIARAVALEPEIIFYDDPTAGLDPITSRKIIELILNLQAKQNSTLIAISNDMNRVYQLASRIIMVVDKTILDTGSKAETLKHQDPRVFQFVRGQTTGPLTARSAP